MKRFSLLLCFLLLNVCASYPQDIKTLLLKNVSQLPMPANGEQPLATFFTVNEVPQIIAVGKLEARDDIRATVIMASILGKGRLLLFGSPAYFESTQLKNSSVMQLFKNALHLSGSKPRIAIFGKSNTALKGFVHNQGGETYDINSIKLERNTDILILSQDVENQVELDHMETFVKEGGTLWFASPYGALNNRWSVANPRGGELKINSLLVKAGAYAYNMVIKRGPKNAMLTTDSIPPYLHINTVLPHISSGWDQYQRNVDYYIINPMLKLVFKYNAKGSTVLQSIKKYYSLPDSIRIPTSANPMILPSERHKVEYKLLTMFYEKAMDFNNHPEAKAGGHELFPGPVAATAVRVKETASIPVKVGTQGLIDPPSVYHRAHSTGYYVPAGEKVKLTISKELWKRGLIAQVGVHSDDVTNLNKMTRTPTNLVSKFPLDKETTEVYSPYGGLLLLSIPDNLRSDTVKLVVDGAVKAPYFKLGETSESEWNASIRAYPGPWAELATDNIVLTVPSYRLRTLNNPEKLMQFWDKVMDADAELAVISKKRVHQERIIVDNDVAYGYMFTTWDRIVVPDDQSCEWMLNEEFISKNGSWGTFHELGHRHQFAYLDFPGTGEVTVNLFTMYVYDKVLGRGLYNHNNLKEKEEMIKRIKAYLANNPSYEKWSADPFLALSMYVQIIDKFGWEAILNVHRIYRKMPTARYPKTDQDKRDLWFVNICKSTNRNLSDFFDTWKVPVSAKAKKQVGALETWFPQELK
ncbi:MAG: M60 family metallopeptidase [Pedobacter sp.]